MKTVGVLLAGGQSRRFGSPKAFATHEGHSFYHYSLEALRPICDKIVVVTRPEFQEQFPDSVHVTTDLASYAGMGPLAGILSAMELMEADRYVVLPCDMPFIEADIMERLLELHDGDISSVTVEGKRHPLVSVWNATVKPTIKQALRDGNRRVMHVQGQHKGQWIEGALLTNTPEIAFKNVNTPCELERG
ncbi:molybdenum cofactor guanylyltransferase [Sporosarcina sp. P12(2017)]|uniref:molybdenum cofactor guanylyltransferase n=1 Tax=unclassified Sporosarcina TaxID=2647733 RepID=UPI000C164DDB|nr:MULTISPECIES: molybdenum cofactor guanylyltransferase [unclassified Sporosarcina]PIC57690.1 molybdenum cofactor guanylyltransferase [Sporosarcina sp. P10]PIC61073.1 molybdenum cofactor guanylyltransferase [Sporosarcina sp. P12(2017)]